jgi:hypothetical protein
MTTVYNVTPYSLIQYYLWNSMQIYKENTDGRLQRTYTKETLTGDFKARIERTRRLESAMHIDQENADWRLQGTYTKKNADWRLQCMYTKNSWLETSVSIYKNADWRLQGTYTKNADWRLQRTYTKKRWLETSMPLSVRRITDWLVHYYTVENNEKISLI